MVQVIGERDGIEEREEVLKRLLGQIQEAAESQADCFIPDMALQKCSHVEKSVVRYVRSLRETWTAVSFCFWKPHRAHSTTKAKDLSEVPSTWSRRTLQVGPRRSRLYVFSEVLEDCQFSSGPSIAPLGAREDLTAVSSPLLLWR